LGPEQFAGYYTVGSSKHHEGKVIFAELDLAFRNSHFEIDHYLDLTVPHPDGSPKKTKFISSYAVLEHIDLKALKSLYLVTTSGKALQLKPHPYKAINEPGLVRIYQEICPLTSLVASTLDQRGFARYITTQTRFQGRTEDPVHAVRVRCGCLPGRQPQPRPAHLPDSGDLPESAAGLHARAQEPDREEDQDDQPEFHPDGGVLASDPPRFLVWPWRRPGVLPHAFCGRSWSRSTMPGRVPPRSEPVRLGSAVPVAGLHQHGQT
jgi:hypothetical protein